MHKVFPHHFKRFIFVTLAIIALFLFLGNVFSKQRETLNCDDFRSYSEALRTYIHDRTDPYGLDGDHDGIPCETLLRFGKA